MPWYEGMGLFQNIAENLVDLVPSSITNAISDTVIDMDADGNQQKARDYEEALKRGENPPPPAGMPDEIIEENKSAAGDRRKQTQTRDLPIFHATKSKSDEDRDLVKEIFEGDHHKKFPLEPYQASPDDRFDEEKMMQMTIGQAKGYIAWGKETGQVNQAWGKFDENGNRPDVPLEPPKAGGMKAG
jgi:hypothetical protein